MIQAIATFLATVVAIFGGWFGVEHPRTASAPAVSTTQTSQSSPATTNNSPARADTTATIALPSSVVPTNVSTTLTGHTVDFHTLPLGDGKYVTSGAKKGFVYLCNVAQGGQGAQANGPWVGATTWNSTQKISVAGNISWPNALVHIAVSGNTRSITGNDLPVNGTTGNFPISSSDPAHQYDGNPNSISAQTLSLDLPAYPTEAVSPQCIYGEVGIMTNGVLLLDAFDAEYRDAGAHEIQDSCEGHPHGGGTYHYHGLSSCISNPTAINIIGWAFDGFPITGPEVSKGKYITSADLDECHGTTSEIMENGKMINTYHYVMTYDFPYSVSCFKGVSHEPKPGGGQTAGGGGQGNAGSPQGVQPPQAALTACAGGSTGSVCSFTTPGGQISGVCQTPPGLSSLACVPR